MIPKIKKVKHYNGFIFQANQELRDITRQLNQDDFSEYMKIFGLRCHAFRDGFGMGSAGVGAGDCTDLELVDALCKNKSSEVKNFSHVLLMPCKGIHYAVEATNEQLLDLFSRLDSLKAFL